MSQHNAFKANSSFFRMLAIGAIGAKIVQTTLNAHGHNVVELERGSLSTRIWRNVKRKRVRIPDLCCTRCGNRIESRAKTKPDLTMSHSPNDAERAWDYGMLDGDWIAFPILTPDLRVWSEGMLMESRSQWREHEQGSWTPAGQINFFSVKELRSVAPKLQKPKGVTEGSEVQVSWKARFAKANGYIASIDSARLGYMLIGSEKEHYFRLGLDEKSFLVVGEKFAENQIVAGQIRPLANDQLGCSGGCDESQIARMLRSRERTVRFTGCKLARFQRQASLVKEIQDLSRDPEEDPYVQMEARAYLCEVANVSANDQFQAILLNHADQQMRLEATVALAEIKTPGAFDLLRIVLTDTNQPLFLRSACAWAIGCHGTEQAAECLVQAFGDTAQEIRTEALMALLNLGSEFIRPLIDGLTSTPEIAAGSSEVLRRLRDVPVKEIAVLAKESPSTWPAWVLGHLPKDSTVPHLVDLQTQHPDIHFSLTMLWTFLESWIAENWTPGATL